MASASAKIDFTRRQFQRVEVNLLGRYMLADKSEHDCRVNNMSPGSASLVCDTVGEIGDRVVAYIDHIGRVEGTIARITDIGFAMVLTSTPHKQEKLAAQLTWLANKHELDLPEDRRHERIAPKQPTTILSLQDGRQYRCRIIDLSLSGAAIAIEVRPMIGTPVTLGNMRGQVVRHFEDGIAIEFAVVQRPESLGDFLGD